MPHRFLPLLAALLLFLLAAPAAPAVPQDSLVFYPEIERIFVGAMRSFQAGVYDTAAQEFLRCIRDFPEHHRITASYIMGAKALYRTGNVRESVRLLKNLIDLYPHSAYVDDAQYTLGLNYFVAGRYEDAAEAFLTARQLTVDALLASRSEEMLDIISDEHLSVGQLQLLLGDAELPALQALLSIRLAEKFYRRGDARSAEEVLAPVAFLPPSVRHVGTAVTLLEQIRAGGVQKLGVVVPLMLQTPGAPLQELGVDILNGIKLAAEEHNERQFPKVTLDVRDSERDPSIAARAVTELCADPKILAVLGPLFSDEAFAAAGIANALNVPLITPTATATGIAAIGPFVFQLNPDYGVRGRMMARYAYEQLGARRFALLAPADGGAASREMAEAFAAEVDSLGGRLVDQQWYQAGSTDLRYQLMSMRQKALEKTEEVFVDFSRRISYDDIKKMIGLGVDAGVLDSLVESGGRVTVEALLGPNGRALADTLGLAVERQPVPFDSLEIAVDSIDAMFLPIASSEEIGIVTSQVRYFNFRAQMLGTGDWNEPSELEQHRRYTNGVIFALDSDVDTGKERYRVMAARYQAMFNRPPTVNSLFGYDAAALLLHVIAGGAAQRASLAAALSTLPPTEGLHTSFVLPPSRVNSFMTLFQYRNRAVSRIGPYHLTSPHDQSTE